MGKRLSYVSNRYPYTPLPAMHLKMYTPLISRLRIMNREFMSLMKGRLLQLRRIRDLAERN
ncbi:hypothetical protein PO124_32395 [Bacillus licheniformis]|nr:hypothetical protein [Bacillus licheniformis]